MALCATLECDLRRRDHRRLSRGRNGTRCRRRYLALPGAWLTLTLRYRDPKPGRAEDASRYRDREEQKPPSAVHRSEPDKPCREDHEESGNWYTKPVPTAPVLPFDKLDDLRVDVRRKRASVRGVPAHVRCWLALAATHADPGRGRELPEVLRSQCRSSAWLTGRAADR
jgi:hypothetical protein